MHTEATPTAVVLAGAGVEAERWGSAFRGVEGVSVDRIDSASDDDLLEVLARPAVDAVAFVMPVADLAGAVKRSLMARRHVFVAGGVALTSKQLLAIERLANRRERTVMFAAATAGDEHLAFVRRMTCGSAAIWRPQYLRATRTGTSAGRSLDELAISELARVLAIVDRLPSSVQAWAPRIDDESGRRDAAMMMLSFDGGLLAQIDVSLVEPMPRHDLVIACEGRTLVLNAFDIAAPLQILGSARHRGPRSEGEWAETVIEHPAAEFVDQTTRSAMQFVEAIRGRAYAKASNARQLADAARVWEAARESMSASGDAVALADEPVQQRLRLKVIQGGGHSDGRRNAAALTLVARG